MQRSQRFLYSHSASHSLVFSLGIPLVAVSPVLQATAAQANTITAANDGTGTVVTRQDAHFTIEQGSFSADGINQFHSLDSFSIEASESASFIAPDNVQNVLTKVSSVAPSIINGAVQVTGEQQPNLYLMNPAGVLIGPDATLNLPGSLTVTTADGVGFEEGWFSAVEESSYERLTGMPTGDFAFSGGESGAVVNEGTITLAADADLTLLGEAVVNTGEITAPGGDITLVAVPGESMVKMRSPNGLLTLEISTDIGRQTTDTDTFGLNPLDLPSLLTDSTPDTVTQLVAHADGTVSLTDGPDLGLVGLGSVVSAGVITAESNDGVGGSVALLGDRVSLTGADISASGLSGGGTIRLGGDYRGGEAFPTATTTLIDRETVIAADAIESGRGGQVSVWADRNTQYLGSITARGGEHSGDGGSVEVSGKQALFFDGVVDTSAPQGDVGSLLLDPENIVIVNGFGGTDDEQIGDYAIFAEENAAQFTLSERTLSRLATNATLTLEATNNITVEPLLDQALSFRPGSGAITLKADADGNGSGDFVMLDPDTTLIAPGRDVSISGANLLLGDINTAALLQGGTIDLTASGNVSTGNIDTHAPQTLSRSGNVNITAANITTRDIFTQSPSQSGNVTLVGTLDSIATGEILTDSLSGANGSINLSAPNGISTAGTVVQEPPSVPVDPVPSEPIPPGPIPVDLDDAGDAPVETEDVRSLLDLTALGLETIVRGGGGLFPRGQSLTSGGDASSLAGGDSDEGGANSRSTVLSTADANIAIANLEGEQTQQFSSYFGRELAVKEQSLEDIQQMLLEIARESGTNSAIVYVKAPVSRAPETDEAASVTAEGASPDTLELLLITANQPVIKIGVPNLPSETLLETVSTFRADLLTSVRRGGEAYLTAGQQLYDWLVTPIEEALSSEGTSDIDTLAFSMDTGLRTLPLAALHDGEQFLIEKYGLGLLPSLGLVDGQYDALADAEVIAMGASEFEQLENLPAVPTEIKRIQSLWPGSAFLNEDFTRQNLIQQQAQSPAEIVHLATHAAFNPGSIDSSYIQLWDEPLKLNEMAQLGWQASDVNLLVLSACRTAVGSPEAELGFAGVALAAGARSTMASLWSVDDVGTLALMSELYGRLGTVPTKAEALRGAQLAMLRGELHAASRQLLNGDNTSASPLLTSVGTITENNLSHPYYWSGFVMIGSPW